MKGFRVGDLVPSLYNAPGAHIEGVDLEFQAAVTSQFSVQANLAYMHARYTDGFTGALFITIPGRPRGPGSSPETATPAETPWRWRPIGWAAFRRNM